MLFTELNVTFDGEIASFQKSITLNFSRDDIKRTDIALVCCVYESKKSWNDMTVLDCVEQTPVQHSRIHTLSFNIKATTAGNVIRKPSVIIVFFDVVTDTVQSTTSRWRIVRYIPRCDGIARRSDINLLTPLGGRGKRPRPSVTWRRPCVEDKCGDTMSGPVGGHSAAFLSSSCDCLGRSSAYATIRLRETGRKESARREMKSTPVPAGGTSRRSAVIYQRLRLTDCV